MSLACSTPEKSSQMNETGQSEPSYPPVTEQLTDEAIAVEKPAGQNYKVLPVYVKSVEKRSLSGEAVLVISGQFPNGCAKLFKADFSVTDDEQLAIEMKSWQPSKAICTQALVPFSYIDSSLNAAEIGSLSEFVIDGTVYEIE